MRNSLMSAALAFALLAAPALAEEPSEEEAPGALAREGVERLMRALNAFIEMIPQYEMPEIDENGDIIIRRKREPEAQPETIEPGDEDDQTST